MRQRKFTNIKVLAVVLVGLGLINKAAAQNIIGDTILVSAETETWMTFASPPSGQVTKDASSFSVFGTGRNLAIKPLKANTRSTTLMVQEGSRTHQFVVFYKDELDPSESVYNFSDLKKVEKQVKEKAAAKSAAPKQPAVEVAQTTPDKPATQPTVSKESQDFALAVSLGDDNFEKEKYVEAKDAYQKALTLKSNNEYAKTKIAAIDKILADKEKLANKLRDDNYNNALLKAAKAFTAKKYDEAKAGYREALDSRPNDKFATNQIVAIDKMITDDAAKAKDDEARRQQEETYKTTIVNADKAFASEDFETAKSYYSLASSYKPDDPYPKRKLDETERKIVAVTKDKESKEREKLYQTTIAKAKAAYDTKNYDMSKELYNEALNVKPNDEVAKAQIKNIDKAIESQTQKELQEKQNEQTEQAFKEAITLADNALKAENYDLAKSEYNKALAIKKDSHAESALKNIASILEKEQEKATSEKEQQAKETLKNSNYDQAIKKGESYYNKKDYINARVAYKQALIYKDEQEPKDKITEIETILAKQQDDVNAEKDRLAKEDENNKKYNEAIIKAKALELNNDFANAKIAYLEALQLKPSDPLPKARIEALDKKVTDLETDKKYDDAVSKGNLAIGDRQFTQALESFREALRMKPLETYPLKQISYVESLMSKETASAEEAKKKIDDATGEATRVMNFNNAMAAYKRADTALNQRRWQDALVEYTNFLRLIPDQKELNSYQYNTAGTIEFAKRKIIDLKNYLNRLKGSTYQSDAVTYSPDDLKKKYPGVDFTISPQSIPASSDTATIINAGKDVAAETARLTLVDSTNNVKLTCLGITKNGNYLYLRMRILNSSTDDFLTGDMNLSVIRKKKPVSMDPVYISTFPVVLPGKEFSLIYATKDAPVDDKEVLTFTMNDRLNKTSIKLSMPGSVFNQERNRQ